MNPLRRAVSSAADAEKAAPRSKRRDTRDYKSGPPKNWRLRRVQMVAQVAALYVEGYTQAEIATKTGLARKVVSNLLKQAEAEMMARYSRDILRHKAVEIEKLNALERQAREEFARSREERKRRFEERVNRNGGKQGDEVRAGTQTDEAIGDPRLLRVIHDSIELRCKIMEHLAPNKMAQTDPEGNALPVFDASGVVVVTVGD